MNVIPEAVQAQAQSLQTAHAVLSRGDRSWSWIVATCPLCGDTHTHHGGNLREDPRLELGYTSAPCARDGLSESGYLLVAAEGQDALGMIAAIGAKAPGLVLRPRALMRRDVDATEGREVWLSDAPAACCATCRFSWEGSHLRSDGSGRARSCWHKPKAQTMPAVKDDHVCLNYDRTEPVVEF
jgi:hypothetical protein